MAAGTSEKLACDITALAAPGVRQLHPYLPGKPISELEREYGVTDIIKLASNENPLGTSKFALNAMQKELQEAAAEGFRLLPSTMIAKNQMFGGVEIIVVLEKVPAADQNYDYLLLATNRTSTLQKEMTQAMEEGYEVVGMVSRGEHMVILERAAQATPS